VPFARRWSAITKVGWLVGDASVTVRKCIHGWLANRSVPIYHLSSRMMKSFTRFLTGYAVACIQGS